MGCAALHSWLQSAAPSGAEDKDTRTTVRRPIPGGHGEIEVQRIQLMTVRKDVYVYNESRGLVVTGKIPAKGRSKKVKASSREQRVLQKAQELAEGGPLPAEAGGRIYERLVEEMRDWEAKIDKATP